MDKEQLRKEAYLRAKRAELSRIEKLLPDNHIAILNTGNGDIIIRQLR